MNRSRLSRKFEKQTIKNLVLSILGILIVLIILFKFGIPLLINLSLFLSGSRTNQEQYNNHDPSFVAPPILDPFPEATSSANIVVSGVASKNQTINLYINDSLIDSIKSKDDGSFSFKETISSGESVIKAKTVVGVENKESEFSQPLTTVFKSAPPSLKIISPSDGQSFSKDQNTTNVQGTTDPDVKITINGFWAITDNAGSFSYSLPLQNGENKIKIIASDIAGNKKEKEIKVTYNP